MPEDFEEFISLTPRTRNSKKPSRMLAINWKRRWLLLCLARQARHVSMVWPVAKPMRPNQNLRASWKPVNPQDCVWKTLYRITMKTILQERETIHCNMKIWFTNLFLWLKPWRFPQQKQQWVKNGKMGKDSGVGQKISQKTNLRWLMKQEKKVEKYTSPEWWTSVIWRVPNWRQSTKNIQVESYSEVTLWKMILDLMQYSLNKVHLRHRGQPQKSWISYPDCQGAQEKQLMQYLLKPM